MNQVRNMADGMQLRMAVAQLRGFRSHVRTPITQVIVDEYQWIIKALEEAMGEYLQQFSIPHGSMRARPLPEIRHTRGFSPLGPQFTQEKYCDKDFFENQINGLWAHIEKVIGESGRTKSSQFDI
jgi:hypothetical protein